MVLTSSSISSEVRFLFQSVNTANIASTHRELLQFASYGSEGRELLLHGCLDQLNGGDAHSLQLRHDLSSAIFKYLMGKPSFSAIFCQALQSRSTDEWFLEDLSNTLKLSLSEKIMIGLASSESYTRDLRKRGNLYCINQLEDLVSNPSASDVSHEEIQDIILYLYRSNGLSEHVDSFIRLLSLVPSSFFTKDPVLKDDVNDFNPTRNFNIFFEGSDDDFESVLSEVESEMGMDDIMREIGPASTASTSHCKKFLSLFLPLNEATIAKLLGTIVRTHDGSDNSQEMYYSFCSALDINSICEPSPPSSWDIDCFIDSIKQIAPEINWQNVIENLDNEGFSIPNETSFSLLMSIYSKSCTDPFPLKAICGFVWKNAEGQLSFLKHAVSAQPDVFTFAHCSRHLPREDIKGGENQAWCCLDLLEVLSQLAERGHASSVRLIIEHPLKEYPDVLLLGIAHVNTPYNLLKYHILSVAFPVVLNHPTKNLVINRLLKIDTNLVVLGCIATHTNPSSLFSAVETCNDVEASKAAGEFMCSSSSSQQHSSFQVQAKDHDFLVNQLNSNAIATINRPNTHRVLDKAIQSSLPSTSMDSTTNPKANTGPLQYPSSQYPSSALATVSSSSGRSTTFPKFGATINIETLVAAAKRRNSPLEAPETAVQDKLSFMINNISKANMEAKTKEFGELIKEQHYPWFAQYMVMKRASIEPNFHDLYLKLLHDVNSKTLNKEVSKATYDNCKALLSSELIKSSSEERSLLKNLGSWLGKFTIGRNQALLAKEIDPKSLIIEAYERGLMIAVIPFTSKVLEPCGSSLAFKPPNPWTMSILGLLVEIYTLPNLKINLKFDIEVLFKNLGVDMKNVRPTALLEDKVRQVEGNPDFSKRDTCVSQAPSVAEICSPVIPAMSQYAPSLHHGSNILVDNEKAVPLNKLENVPSAQGLIREMHAQPQFCVSQILATVPAYGNNIKINATLNRTGLVLQIHRLMKAAMDKAIKEIALLVIPTSVTMVCLRTRELVLQGFLMGANAKTLCRPAQSSVRTLVGDLVRSNCKEPLKVALSNNLHKLLQTLNINGQLLDQIVELLIDDNINLGCALVERVASEKAMELIVGEIGSLFTTMKKQEEAAGSAYYDASTFTQGPKMGRVSASLKRVYDDFLRNVGMNRSSQSDNAVPAAPSCLDDSSTMPRVYGSSCRKLESYPYPSSQAAPGSSVFQKLGLVQEYSDSGPAQIRENGGVIPQAAEINSIPQFVPAAPSPGLCLPETIAVSKDMGALVHPSPRIPGAEKRGIQLATELLINDFRNNYKVLEVKVHQLFSEWCNTCELPANDASQSHFISQLQQNDFLNCDDTTELFLRILTKHSVAHYLTHEQDTTSLTLSSQPIQFVAIDAYAKLVSLLLKYFSVDERSMKFLLMKILQIAVEVIHMDAEENKLHFNPRPYFRLFINWLMDLTSETFFDCPNFQILDYLVAAFHALQPLKVPAFSFAWFQLVSHNSFMPKILSCAPNGPSSFHQLLIGLFKFLEPYLRNAELGEPVQLLYRGTMRVLLVLMHDFPEFLCDYHLSFCDVIPTSCIQMRNVVLSAYPHDTKVPNPLAVNLKIDLLAEISQAPRIPSDVGNVLRDKQIKIDIEEYIETKTRESAFLTELKQKLFLRQDEVFLSGTRYNVPLINALVLHVGMQAIQQIQTKSATQDVLTNQRIDSHPMDISLASAALDIFQTLINNLDTEGRYLFLNAIANQLRHPNSHTHYFVLLVLFLFSEASQEIIREQIARVLCERLCCNKPHPWGLQVTFVELIKNPIYGFWSNSFTRCTPDIEHVLATLSSKINAA